MKVEIFGAEIFLFVFFFDNFFDLEESQNHPQQEMEKRQRINKFSVNLLVGVIQ